MYADIFGGGELNPWKIEHDLSFSVEKKLWPSRENGFSLVASGGHEHLFREERILLPFKTRVRAKDEEELLFSASWPSPILILWLGHDSPQFIALEWGDEIFIYFHRSTTAIMISWKIVFLLAASAARLYCRFYFYVYHSGSFIFMQWAYLVLCTNELVRKQTMQGGGRSSSSSSKEKEEKAVLAFRASIQTIVLSRLFSVVWHSLQQQQL